MLSQLYQQVKHKRKLQLKFVLALTIVTAFFEILSLGSVIPFLAIILNPDKIHQFEFVRDVLLWLNAFLKIDVSGVISLIFIITSITAGLFRIILLNQSIALGNLIGADLSLIIYERTLKQPYVNHIKIHSSEIISAITQKVEAATSVFNAAITFITSCILFIAIFAALIFFHPVISTFVLLVFGSAYFLLYLTFKRPLKSNGHIIAHERSKIVQFTQEGLGAFREIYLYRRIDFFLNNVKTRFYKLAIATSSNVVLTLAPRYFMETVALVIFGASVFFLRDDQETLSSTIPILGVLALGAQRLLPVLQQLYSSYGVINGHHASISDIVELLSRDVVNFDSPNYDDSGCLFESLELENVFYSYSDGQNFVVRNLNIFIEKGDVVGIIGETGSGKSTALDVLLGLLPPKLGNLRLNGSKLEGKLLTDWHNTISHVPQEIFLTDTSIKENVAFGKRLNDIDMDLVEKVCRQAELENVIQNLPGGLNYKVGENGVNLSGGQRQRIGIARALYRNSNVIILDEATSSLDEITEINVIENMIESKIGITIILITHKKELLKFCNKIYHFSRNGNVTESKIN